MWVRSPGVDAMLGAVLKLGEKVRQALGNERKQM